MADARLPRFYCMKCGYQWVPRKHNPHGCPRCNNPKYGEVGREQANPDSQREKPSGS